MAGQFDAASDRVSYSASNPPVPSAGISFAGWFRIDVDRNDFSTVMRLHAAGGGSTTLTIGTGSNGVTMQVFSAGGTVASTAAVVGDWYRVGYTLNGTGATLYLADVDGPVQVFTGTVTAGANPTGLTIAGRSVGDSDEPLTGTLACHRIWAAVLNQAEFEAEWAAPEAVRTADLWADWPLDDDLLDASGNGRNLTGGPPTFVDGPPLSTPITGSGSVTAPAADVAGAGSVVVSASGTLEVPSATVSGAAGVVVSATGAVVAPVPVLAGVGAVVASGQGGLLAPVADVAGVGGVVVTGAGSVVAPASDVSGSDAAPVTVPPVRMFEVPVFARTFEVPAETRFWEV